MARVNHSRQGAEKGAAVHEVVSALVVAIRDVEAGRVGGIGESMIMSQ